MKEIIIRIWFIIKSFFFDALASFEQIERDGRQVIRDLDADIVKTENSLVDIITYRNELNIKIEQTQTKSDEISAIVKRAILKRDDDGARKGIQLTHTYLKEVETNKAVVVHLNNVIDVANGQINNFRQQRNDIDSEIKMLAVQYNAAKLEERIMGSRTIGSGTITIQTLRDRVTKAKARTEAVREVKSDDDATLLVQQYSQLGSLNIDAELLKMKQELGVTE